jgi:hypothetical protein
MQIGFASASDNEIIRKHRSSNEIHTRKERLVTGIQTCNNRLTKPRAKPGRNLKQSKMGQKNYLFSYNIDDNIVEKLCGDSSRSSFNLKRLLRKVRSCFSESTSAAKPDNPTNNFSDTEKTLGKLFAIVCA